MKKIILLTAIAVSSIASYAQCSFGGQVGLNLGMGHAKYGGGIYGAAAATALTNDPKVGFLIGVLAEMDFGKIAFRPELNFVQRGSKSGYYDAYYSSNSSEKRTLNYIELPLNVVYKLDLGPGNVFFGLGPSIGIGLSGKDKYPDAKYDVKFDGKKSADLSSGDNDSHLKRVDFGINVLAGYKLPMGAFAKIGYTHGLNNIDPDKNDPDYLSTYYNRGLSICIGYMIGGSDKKKK